MVNAWCTKFNHLTQDTPSTSKDQDSNANGIRLLNLHCRNRKCFKTELINSNILQRLTWKVMKSSFLCTPSWLKYQVLIEFTRRAFAGCGLNIFLHYRTLIEYSRGWSLSNQRLIPSKTIKGNLVYQIGAPPRRCMSSEFWWNNFRATLFEWIPVYPEQKAPKFCILLHDECIRMY